MKRCEKHILLLSAKIKKTGTGNLKISFIIPYGVGEEYNAYTEGHSLQLELLMILFKRITVAHSKIGD